MSTGQPQKIGRRDLLKGAVASSAALASSSLEAAEQSTKEAHHAALGRDSGLIRRENEKPGTRDWQLPRVRVNRDAYRTSLIEGY